MTNIVPLRAMNDDVPSHGGGDPPGAATARQWMADCLAELKDLQARYLAIQNGFQPGLDIYDYIDECRFAMVVIRNQAQSFCQRWSEEAEHRGVPGEISAMIMPNADTAARVIFNAFDDYLKRRRPEAPQYRPVHAANVNTNGHGNVGNVFMGIIGFILLIVVSVATAGHVKPGVWHTIGGKTGVSAKWR